MRGKTVHDADDEPTGVVGTRHDQYCEIGVEQAPGALGDQA